MKQKKQLALLIVLLVVAGSVWYFFYFRTSETSGASGNIAAVRPYQLLGIDNPELHWPELNAARKSDYKSNGRNPFSPDAPPPQVVNTAKNEANHLRQTVPLPPVIPAPTLPPSLKFFGYGTVPNGTARLAFFSDGDDVLIVSEGETLLGRFRIVKVNNTNLEFEEIATGRHNTTPLVEEQIAGGQPST